MFDASKRFIHLEDNADGTMTFTINLGDSFDGAARHITAVQKGSFEEVIRNMATIITPEQLASFQRETIIIPNEAPTEA